MLLLRKVGDHDLLVILEVQTHTGQVDKRLDARLAELLWVADTRALENEGRAESASRHDDLLAGFDDPGWTLPAGQVLGGNNLDANSTVAFEDDLDMLAACQ